MSHRVMFIDRRARERKEWNWPRQADAACAGDGCTIQLGKWVVPGAIKIECERCPAWALVAVNARPDDPLEFTMPCGRLLMLAEREVNE